MSSAFCTWRAKPCPGPGQRGMRIVFIRITHKGWVDQVSCLWVRDNRTPSSGWQDLCREVYCQSVKGHCFHCSASLEMSSPWIEKIIWFVDPDIWYPGDHSSESRAIQIMISVILLLKVFLSLHDRFFKYVWRRVWTDSAAWKLHTLFSQMLCMKYEERHYFAEIYSVSKNRARAPCNIGEVGSFHLVKYYCASPQGKKIDSRSQEKGPISPYSSSEALGTRNYYFPFSGQSVLSTSMSCFSLYHSKKQNSSTKSF